MATLIFPTEMTLSGPLHFDTDALRALDKVLDDAVARFDEAAENAGEPGAPARDWGDLTIRFKSGKKFEAQRFSEAIMDPVTLHESVQGFSVYVTHHHLVACTIEVDCSAKEPLTITTTPPGNERAVDLFMHLREWTKRLQLPTQARVWGSKTGEFLVTVVLGVSGTLMLLPLLAQPPSNLKTQVSDLLEGGVTKAEEGKALELVLRYVLDPEATKGGINVSFLFWPCVIVFVAALILLILRPRTTIGIGLGDRSIAWQRSSMWWVTTFLPYTVLAGITTSAIGSLVYERWLSK